MTVSSFRRATPVLKAADYDRARSFYRQLLGFRICEEGGDPPRFGIFERGSAVIFVNAWNGGPVHGGGGWAAYFHVDRIESLRDEFIAAGVELYRPLTDTVYGMREFEIRDPDGNVLCFGEDAGVDHGHHGEEKPE